MIDLTGKEHEKHFLPIVELCEKDGYEVVCYKETYTEAKCLIGGWDIPISHYADNAKRYYEKIIKGQIENAEKLLSLGMVECRHIDLPKFKKVKSKLANN